MSEGSEWVEKTYSLQRLTEYIKANPNNVSLASKVVNHPDSALYYGENIPRPMGSLGFYFIITGYVSAFEKGDIDPGTTFKWDVTNRHVLPGINELIHSDARSAAMKKGWLSDGMITYGRALYLLAEHNSSALADYLWFKMENNYWQSLITDLELKNTDYPVPLSGLYLALAPNIRELSFEEILDHWQSLSKKAQSDLVIGLAESFATDDSVRSEYLKKLNQNRLDNTFIQERNALGMFPKTTAAEMVDLLEKMWDNQLVSEPVSRKIKNILKWPMEEGEIRRNLTTYGAMYDNRMGLLNGIDFGISAYTGDITVQAVFFDRLPISFWFHMSSNHMHQDFQQRLIYDPALIELVENVASDDKTVSANE